MLKCIFDNDDMYMFKKYILNYKWTVDVTGLLHRDCLWHSMTDWSVHQSDGLWEETVFVSGCFGVQGSVLM